jgi:hypothetical protein
MLDAFKSMESERLQREGTGSHDHTVANSTNTPGAIIEKQPQLQPQSDPLQPSPQQHSIMYPVQQQTLMQPNADPQQNAFDHDAMVQQQEAMEHDAAPSPPQQQTPETNISSTFQAPNVVTAFPMDTVVPLQHSNNDFADAQQQRDDDGDNDDANIEDGDIQMRDALNENVNEPNVNVPGALDQNSSVLDVSEMPMLEAAQTDSSTANNYDGEEQKTQRASDDVQNQEIVQAVASKINEPHKNEESAPAAHAAMHQPNESAIDEEQDIDDEEVDTPLADDIVF